MMVCLMAKRFEYAPRQFAETAKEALEGLLWRRGIGPHTEDGDSVADLIEMMIEDKIERLADRRQKEGG
jgi:hypothetical protein